MKSKNDILIEANIARIFYLLDEDHWFDQKMKSFDEKKYRYLDHSATTPVDPAVVQAMLPYFSEKYGNPSSLHSKGQETHNAIENSRKSIAKFLNCKPEELLFVGGGTESDNIAILGVARKLKSYGNHIITSNIEHSAVRNTIRHLKEEGFEVSEIPVDNLGVLHVEDVEKAIRPTTILVSVMFANNEIGTIQPIKDLAELTNRKNIILHTDAVQAIGKIRINLQEIKIDLLSATAHKIYGPKGIGLLFFRNTGNHLKFGRYIDPIIYGGGHEQGYRPSTENVPGIVGFAKAIELADKDLESEMARETQLRDEFIQWALNNIPESFLNGHPKFRLANNINLGFRFVEGESLILSLDEKGIAVSTGSACSSHSSEPSHVLQALNLKKEDMHGSVRITLGRTTTPADLDYVKIQLKEVVATLRKYSPLTPESLKNCSI